MKRPLVACAMRDAEEDNNNQNNNNNNNNILFIRIKVPEVGLPANSISYVVEVGK